MRDSADKRRILIATSLNRTSHALIEKAVEPFLTASSAVGVCHVRWAPERYLDRHDRDAAADSLDRETRDRLAAWSKGFLERHPLLAPRQQTFHVEVGDFPHIGIARIAKEWKPDLIVLGESRRQGSCRLFLGGSSVAEDVAREIQDVDILIAKPAPLTRRDGEGTVIAATALSDDSFPALKVAADVVRRRQGTRLIVAHVLDGANMTDEATPMATAAATAARRWVHHGMAKTRAYGKVDIRVGSPKAELLACAESNKATLLILASPSRRRTTLHRLIHGCLTKEMILSAPCSILSVARLRETNPKEG